MSLGKLIVILYFMLSYLPYVRATDSTSYVMPVDHPLSLTGNFMEIRNNHYHAGIDIRSSKGRSGDAVRSIADGYISRIKIMSGSYGNVLYIDHPHTGHTSVYAHLDQFSPRIQELVKNVQYAYESFEVDIYLPPYVLEVSSSERIGNMGNTGRSSGPHLHFEIRDTDSEEPLNPEAFGIGPDDTRPPVVQTLFLYELNEKGTILDKQVLQLNRHTHGYAPRADKIAINSNYFAVGIGMYDNSNPSYNRNGVYGYELYINDSLSFGWKADRFNFDENASLNGFIDFHERKTTGQKIYRLFNQPCLKFSGFRDSGTGINRLEEEERAQVNIEVFDIRDNSTSVSFEVYRATPVSTMANSEIRCDSAIIISTSDFTVTMEPFTLYRPMELKCLQKQIVFENTTFPAISIGSPAVAVNKFYRIYYRGNIKLNEKWTLVKRDANGSLRHFGLHRSGQGWYSMVDELGTYFLYRDTVRPTIEPIGFSPSMKSPWVFKISDNLVPDGKMDQLYFEARANGKWLLMQYDLKTKQLRFDDFSRLPEKPFLFELIVRDACGNEKIYSRVVT